MPVDYSILKLNPAFSKRFLITEFATIISTLHNNQTSKLSYKN